MAERFRKYKDIVDHEKDAVARKLAAEFDREKEALAAGSKANVELGQALIKSLVDFGSSVWPYIPIEARALHLELIQLPPTHQTLKAVLLSYANQAPDLSGAPASFHPHMVAAIRELARSLPAQRNP